MAVFTTKNGGRHPEMIDVSWLMSIGYPLVI
jgi:hypothetical protein